MSSRISQNFLVRLDGIGWYVASVVALFCYIYPLPFIGWAIITFGALLLVTNKGAYLYQYKSVQAIMLQGLLLFSWMLFACARVGSFEGPINSFVFNFWGGFLKFSFFAFIWTKTIRKNNTSFLELLFTVVFIQSVFVVLLFCFPELRPYVFSVVGSPPAESTFRAGGFTSVRVFGLGAIQSVGMLIYPFLLFREKKTSFKSVLLSIAYLFILFSSIVSARITFISFAISLILLAYFSSKAIIRRFKVKVLWDVCKMSVTVLILSNILLNYVDILGVRVAEWLKEPFVRLLDDNDQAPFDYINKKFYWFPNTLTFFIGDGFYLNPSGRGYYMATDAGYMRCILFIGLVGSIMLYSIHILMLYYIAVACMRLKCNHMLFLYIAVLFCWYFYHWKGELLIGDWNVLIVLLMVTLNRRMLNIQC